MRIPPKFKEILDTNQKLSSLVMGTVSKYSVIMDEEPFFFPEYTNHKIIHSQQVLEISERLTDKESINQLTPSDVAVIVLASLGHDLGMHITFNGFKALISDDLKPSFDNVYLKDKSWSKHWYEYIKEIKLWSDKKKLNSFGKVIDIIDIPENVLDVTYSHRLIVGEFLRRFHHRLAQEIIISGYPLKKGEVQPFLLSDDYNKLKIITALVSRSHGEDLWKMIDVMEREYGRYAIADKISDIHVYFIMSLIRLADYLDFSVERAARELLCKHEFVSKISNEEWEMNQCIESIDYGENYPETIFIWVNEPPTSQIFLKIEKQIKGMQSELDVCWAVLGYTHANLKLAFRRISSNIEGKDGLKSKVKYIPEKICFDSNRELMKLLIQPLYGDDIRYAFRELLQNAVDACTERENVSKKPIETYVKFIFEEDSITVEDNGIGMTERIIKEYFLVAGASYRDDLDWKKTYCDEKGSKIIRGGRFGIGVLACFLLGDKIEVSTKPYNEKWRYTFATDLDSDQIDVYKEKSSDDSGTSIKIYNNFDNIIITRENISKYFNDLFYFSKPLLIVKTSLKEYLYFSKNIDFKSMFYFKMNNHIEIYWKYNYFLENNLITYNGIILEDEQLIDSNNLKIKNIEVHILDVNNELKLELNRKRIVNNINVKNKIILEISKSIISTLLFVNMNNSSISFKCKYLKNTNKYLTYMYHNKGYLPLCFLRVKNLIGNYVLLCKSKEKKLDLLSHYSKNNIFIIYERDNDMLSLDNIFRFKCIKTINCINPFKEFNNFLSININNKEVMYDQNYQNVITNITDDLAYKDGRFELYIIEKTFRVEYYYKQSLSFPDINSIFNNPIFIDCTKKYLKDHFIPYNQEEKLKLFGDAIKELQPYYIEDVSDE